jgi:hypothetical protein
MLVQSSAWGGLLVTVGRRFEPKEIQNLPSSGLAIVERTGHERDVAKFGLPERWSHTKCRAYFQVCWSVPKIAADEPAGDWGSALSEVCE